ncbi:O-acetylhomoserine/O-acetylserine sulfhydrylase [Elusimicrobium minutum Pei191]|uniref:O-acetylhomoserine/O-acetylserine sulfhydrylase n=1 Tax=Elusimicrobium minutum (strain Pei191) TaxID=445932 RepID=B2KBU3_ELUMP|nr:O-acetylhomoserine aminocarboxypropyltransferase/cysteine synthase family protein [Elusimicrobium minutum]ACC97847.1 O-acetylhomoserine/O-acetylserine sulfhydrylase [Elusimicrobium minutum Pei191]
MTKQHIETLAVSYGFEIDETGSSNPPLYLSNAYKFNDAKHAKDLFDLKAPGYIYTRLNNPTNNFLEERINALEGGAGTLVTASGHSAEFMTICALAETGDEIISSNALYGGTFNMFSHSLRRLGIKVKFADVSNPAEFENLVTDKTKAIFVESISNPGCEIPDFEQLSKIAKKHKIPFIVDNTCMTPYLFKPKDFGADIIIHSTTKFLSGHAAVMGGSVTDCGTFDWTSGRFPSFCNPDPSYHNIVYAKDFAQNAFIVKLRTQVLRDIGACQSPFNSYLTLQGIQTLHVRMDRHLENTLKLIDYLKNNPKIAWVKYPLVEGNPFKQTAEKYFKKGCGSLFSFGLKGGYEAGKKLIENVTLCLHATNLGDVRTIVTHPASTTHSQLTKEEKQKTAIGDDLIRISVGIENIDDIIADLEKALI